MFIGTLASVDPSLRRTGKFKAFETLTAVRTMGALSGVLPAGRKPTISGDTLTAPLPPQRLFSSSTASLSAALNFAFSASSDFTSAERISTSIQPSKGMAFTDVPPPTRPTLKVVLGVVGTSKASIFAIARPIA